jgi:hypothetical protein
MSNFSNFDFNFNNLNLPTSPPIPCLEEKMAAWTAKDPSVRFIALNLYASDRSDKTRLTSEKGRISWCAPSGRPGFAAYMGQLTCLHIWQPITANTSAWVAPSAVNKESQLVEGEPALGIIAEVTAYTRLVLNNAAEEYRRAGNTTQADELKQRALAVHHSSFVEDEIVFNLPVSRSWIDERYRTLKALDKAAGNNRCLVLACRIGWSLNAKDWIPSIQVLEVLSTTEPAKALRRETYNNLDLKLAAQLLVEQAEHEAAVAAAQPISVVTQRLAEAAIEHQRRGCNNRAAQRRAYRKMQQQSSNPPVVAENKVVAENNAATLSSAEEVLNFLDDEPGEL